MNKKPNFLSDKICLNVLANSLENAKELYEVTEGHILIGILASKFKTIEEGIEEVKEYQKELNGSVSVGLGDGDPSQWKRVAQISATTNPLHVNQISTATGYTRGLVNQDNTLINSLVSPTGKIGYVNIATGVESSTYPPLLVPIKLAITMLKEIGANSLKFFPMKGTNTLEEYEEVCRVAGEMDFIVEPTGGLNLENFEIIVSTALDKGVPKIIPHVYSSIIDEETGDTNVEDVAKLYEIMKTIV